MPFLIALANTKLTVFSDETKTNSKEMKQRGKQLHRNRTHGDWFHQNCFSKNWHWQSTVVHTLTHSIHQCDSAHWFERRTKRANKRIQSNDVCYSTDCRSRQIVPFPRESKHRRCACWKFNVAVVVAIVAMVGEMGKFVEEELCRVFLAATVNAGVLCAPLLVAPKTGRFERQGYVITPRLECFTCGCCCLLGLPLWKYAWCESWRDFHQGNCGAPRWWFRRVRLPSSRGVCCSPRCWSNSSCLPAIERFNEVIRSAESVSQMPCVRVCVYVWVCLFWCLIIFSSKRICVTSAMDFSWINTIIVDEIWEMNDVTVYSITVYSITLWIINPKCRSIFDGS